jgi:hypothetical protein
VKIILTVSFAVRVKFFKNIIIKMDLNNSSEDDFENRNYSYASNDKQKKYRLREKLKVEQHSIYESNNQRKVQRKNTNAIMNKFQSILELSDDELSNVDDHFETENIVNNNDSYSEMEFTDTDIETDYELPSNDSIFDGSNIKVFDFALSFLLLCKKIKINTKAKDTILEYIATILPLNNKIPSSFEKLVKNFKIPLKKRNYVTLALKKLVIALDRLIKRF